MSDQLFIRLDVDNAGDAIELALFMNDYNTAQKTHDNIQDSVKKALKKIADINSSEILMSGCDDILFKIEKANYNPDLLQKLISDFKNETSLTLSIGIGRTLKDALINLKIAKMSGKNKIVHYEVD
ncbi:mCpol domain-containing protein [uncultured Flavobacterium sp.]|uniref:mCpol domain-containing protein n=1 Tax=uncultured Flavobacterium sp. TaxID=165435 RepID=UPI0025959BE9|nr:mCpol domain-containing protein [uncultured Flavobacterium sp.]